ncbi:hypothetical protein E2P84_42140 [Burkholderia cepacia]|uniref:Uncharacterized protein n=1 Tax=Burkholderia cepacia TaxID=292 RepID=A0AAX2RAG3_BURCE|nr:MULTISPECIES: hypothetical protein [Burkholderia cepacia complex]MCA7890105.1 hypothetical protein [Burkholderia contaminans]MDN7577187.1 hypothetical protein [Burkholderia contaminans]TES62299.1 hypothetical protein E2P84_42140 [Burkholderia cepacia]TES95500.1 hypothetical protein E3D36_38380 [Burkholderia cepacia]TEU31426.1 hypothetical protein E3D37_45010 [Burkholderia cepacia]
MTSKYEEQFINIAADSIASLRKPDVFRVLDTVPCDNIDGVTRADMARYITKMRPDLVNEVAEVMRDEFPEDKWRDDDAQTAEVVPSSAEFEDDTPTIASNVRPVADEGARHTSAVYEAVGGTRGRGNVGRNAGQLAREMEKGVRSAADSLTVAYIAIAAREALSQHTVELDGFNGELGFLEAATDHALFVDRVSDWFDCIGHPGVFAYDVAAPFGAAVANAMIEGKSIAISPGPILRAVMVSARYEPMEVDEAIAAVRL